MVKWFCLFVCLILVVLRCNLFCDTLRTTNAFTCTGCCIDQCSWWSYQSSTSSHTDHILWLSSGFHALLQTQYISKEKKKYFGWLVCWLISSFGLVWFCLVWAGLSWVDLVWFEFLTFGDRSHTIVRSVLFQWTLWNVIIIAQNIISMPFKWYMDFVCLTQIVYAHIPHSRQDWRQV